MLPLPQALIASKFDRIPARTGVRQCSHRLVRSVATEQQPVHALVSAASESEEHAREIQQAGAENESEREASKPGPSMRGPKEIERPQPGVLNVGLLVFVALAVIVLDSTGLFRSTTLLTAGWLASRLQGTPVLSVLTGIPNLYSAVRLAQRRRIDPAELEPSCA